MLITGTSHLHKLWHFDSREQASGSMWNPCPLRGPRLCQQEDCDRVLSDDECSLMALPASVPLALDEAWPEVLLRLRQATMDDYYQVSGSYGVCNEGITMAAG